MFYKEELIHMSVSVLTITLAFSLPTLAPFPLVLLTVGLGFVLHEIAHKFIAIRFGCMAVYKAWVEGLILAIALAFFTNGRFVFAAPGAVYVFKPGITKREDGIISLAGPFTNFLLAFGFLYLGSLGLNELGAIGFSVNMLLGIFNMIPFYPLDGSKVFAWSKGTWLGLIGIMLLSNIFVMGGF